VNAPRLSNEAAFVARISGEQRREISTSPISASGRGRCRAAGRVSRIAGAQTCPARPVRIIVGFAPGGTTDIAGRLMGQWLSERFGQQFVIENRTGAVTNIATEAVVRAPADGYTLLVVTASNAINATLYDKLNFNFIREIAPVAGIIASRLASDARDQIRIGHQSRDRQGAQDRHSGEGARAGRRGD
jgi:ribosomal protein S18 acetylase RimI-like enzyme